MAGISDLPYRQLCRQMGAGMAVSEMVHSDPKVRDSRKSTWRSNHVGEVGPIAVQLVGVDAQVMATAARHNVDQGAEIIDINMGCPAKKVCKRLAGSALMKDERLVQSILESVVDAVDVPVTLKIRTGWDPANRNAVAIAKLAENCGIQSLVVHGRTRACGYTGDAEYQTIREVKQSVGIPVIANGDITTPKKARQVLSMTGADGVMIGRGAQGNPWIFEQTVRFLETDEIIAEPSYAERAQVVCNHVKKIYDLYGEHWGVKMSRKHLIWYTKNLPFHLEFRRQFNQLECASVQFDCIEAYFEMLSSAGEKREKVA